MRSSIPLRAPWGPSYQQAPSSPTSPISPNTTTLNSAHLIFHINGVAGVIGDLLQVLCLSGILLLASVSPSFCFYFPVDTTRALSLWGHCDPIHILTFVWMNDFTSFRLIPGREIAGSQVQCLALEKCLTLPETASLFSLCILCSQQGVQMGWRVGEEAEGGCLACGS